MERNLRSFLNLWVTVYIRNKTQISDRLELVFDKNLINSETIVNKNDVISA